MLSSCLAVLTVREVLIVRVQREAGIYLCFAKVLVSVVEDLPVLFDLKTDGLSCCQVF